MVKIDKEKCISCGSCASLCPEVFELDENNIAQIKSDKKCEKLNEIIDLCPGEAISE